MSTKEYTGAEDVLAKIKTYPDDFRLTAEKIHEIILSVSDDLYPRLWYGMPGYAKSKTGPVVVYFRKDKYITFGKTESSNIEFDESGNPVATAWFLKELNEATISKIKLVVEAAIK